MRLSVWRGGRKVQYALVNEQESSMCTTNIIIVAHRDLRTEKPDISLSLSLSLSPSVCLSLSLLFPSGWVTFIVQDTKQGRVRACVRVYVCLWLCSQDVW